MPLTTILISERDKLKKTILDFLEKNIPSKEMKLETELLIDNLIKIQESMTESVYFDMAQIKKKCDACSYHSIEPKDGDFFAKADTYLKERSKWMWIVIGTIATLCTIIVGIYLFWFMQVATTVFEIKDVMIESSAQIKTNSKRLDRLESIYFKDK